MPHVVTQSCVGDGSCVFACPVNCIQPTPDDPRFEHAEMLHIDPETCVDCGACVSACPVEAIRPHSQLTPGEAPFEVINAAYHRTDSAVPRRPLAPVRPPLVVRLRGQAPRVAVVGSGPAAMYAADEILTIPGARVSVFERLPVPDGLVRSGVAPDHRRTRRIARQLERIRCDPRLTLHLGVEVGRDVIQEALLQDHHAVVYGTGAATERPLELPGAALPGVMSATQLVGWYNGHPDHASRTVDLSSRRAVVIGNGNVALDIARMLTCDPESLVDTEITRTALDALRASRIEEVVVVGRRGPAHSAFTLPELVGLAATPGIALSVEGDGLAGELGVDPKLDLLRSLPAGATGTRRVILRYWSAPVAVRGARSVTGIELARSRAERGDAAASGPAATQVLSTGLVITSIGYRGAPVPELPFDAATGTVPNEGGRVVPGVYVVGWIKRGATGFIGTNKGCAQDTVATLVDDYNAGLLGVPLDANHAAGTAPSRGRLP